MAASEEEMDKWFTSLKKFAFVVLLHIINDFTFAPLIGKGNFADVYVGIKKDTGERYAIKSFDKKKLVHNHNGMVN